MNEQNIIGEATNYEQLHALLRLRADQLNISRETLDSVSGLHGGYVSKLLAPIPYREEFENRHAAHKRVTFRGIGRTSMGPILGALGVKLLLVEDVAAMERIKNRLQPRDVGKICTRPPRKPKSLKERITEFFSQHGTNGARVRNKRLSKRQRVASARHAIRARWRNRKKNGGALEARLAKKIKATRRISST